MDTDNRGGAGAGIQPEAGFVLRIAGGHPDEAWYAFAQAHPETPVLLPDYGEMSAFQAAGAIDSGEPEADIFTISDLAGLPMLLRGAYAADLSGSRALAADLAAMYPRIQAALSDAGGVPRAYPVAFSCAPMLVHTDRFAACFPGEALPETWENFLRMGLRFGEEPRAGKAFLDAAMDRGALARVLLKQFARQYGAGGGVDFDHPALRTALELIARLPEGGGGASVFSLNDVRGEFAPGSGYRLLAPPVFEPGQDPSVEGRLTCMVVNPKGRNPDAAMAYLETVPGAMARRTRLALHPALDGENQGEAARALADYRAIAPWVSLAAIELFRTGGMLSGDVDWLIGQYLGGEIKLRKFLRELHVLSLPMQEKDG